MLSPYLPLTGGEKWSISREWQQQHKSREAKLHRHSCFKNITADCRRIVRYVKKTGFRFKCRGSFRIFWRGTLLFQWLWSPELLLLVYGRKLKWSNWALFRSNVSEHINVLQLFSRYHHEAIAHHQWKKIITWSFNFKLRSSVFIILHHWQ